MRRAVLVPLTITVGAVLADSAIVTLALPAILRDLGGTVSQVAWVLIAYNLMLAIAVVPAAWVCTRANPARLGAAGIVVFAAASASCALADSMSVLITARFVQALGGAFVLVACLELLVAELGEQRGIRQWTVAGVVGTATGPFAGGLLTEWFSWQSIFIVQVPLAIAAVPAALLVRAPRVQLHERHRPAIRPNLTLALLSAALTAALFLLVLLLVEGWQRSPITAAVTVSVVPLAAFVAAPTARRFGAGPRAETAAGCLLIAGGLVALALPPSADLAWTVAPQALIGLGLGLTIDSLTYTALRDRLPRALHGGWTIGARHLGVVLALAILTPVFTADLRDAQVPAQEAIAASVLDARLLPEQKIALARELADRLEEETGRVPDLHPAFEALHVAPAQQAAAGLLEDELDEQLERAATRAFRDSFLIGAGLALLALPLLLPVPRRREP